MATLAELSDLDPAVPAAELKPKPSQRRGKHTFETVLTTAGALLAEVGFERLSTNLVCERAGLTPPALYRYFPNKYSILRELAGRLMDAQDQAVFDWLDDGGLAAGAVEESIEKVRILQKRVNAITRSHPGGVWILRALRAVPELQEIQQASRRRVATRLLEAFKSAHPHLPDKRLPMASRMITSVMYAAMEMMMEEPETDEELITDEICAMVGLYYQDLLNRSCV